MFYIVIGGIITQGAVYDYLYAIMNVMGLVLGYGQFMWRTPLSCLLDPKLMMFLEKVLFRWSSWFAACAFSVGSYRNCIQPSDASVWVRYNFMYKLCTHSSSLHRKLTFELGLANSRACRRLW